jgi:hypothetical protein
MLDFLVDNVYVVLADQVFQQSGGISIGTNCAPLLADLFLYSYDAELLTNCYRIKTKPKENKLAVSFNHTYRY